MSGTKNEREQVGEEGRQRERHRARLHRDEQHRRASDRSIPTRSRQILERIPTRRRGKAYDIAGACVFLCPPAKAYVHGAILPVDRGWLAR